MSARLAHRLAGQEGSALIVAVIVLTLVFSISGVVFSEALTLNRGVRQATGSQRAFQAAQAGMDQALARVNVLQPAAGSCVTTVVAAPDASGWCAASSTEDLGNGQSFSYRVTSSPPPSGVCVGDTLPAGSGGRCIVATGTADGATARMRTRIAITTDPIPFSSTTSVIGYREVKVKKDAKITGVARTNGKLRLESGASLNGYVPELGPKAKVKGYTGAVTRKTSPFVPALPDFWVIDPATSTRRDTAVWNDNPTLVNAISANPKVTYSGSTTRELTIGDGVQVTIPAGIYNFCKLTLGKDARINIAPLKITDPSPKDAVRIFIDSKDRAGSHCADRGTLDSKSGASFINSNSDPRSLQIFAWSKRSKLKVANKQKFAGIIYAPASKVSFNSSGEFIGGIAADKVDINKKMKATFSNQLTSWVVPKLNASQVVAWNQCTSTNTSADPQAGC